MAGTFPRALELAASPLLATWSPGPTTQNLGTTGIVAHGASAFLGVRSSVEEPSHMLTSLSSYSSSSSIGSAVAALATTAWLPAKSHSFHICTQSQSDEDRVGVRSCLQSALVIHSTGITSPMYQCLPCPPQFRHL